MRDREGEVRPKMELTKALLKVLQLVLLLKGLMPLVGKYYRSIAEKKKHPWEKKTYI